MTHWYFFISQLLWTSLPSLRKPQLGEGASHTPQAPCVRLRFLPLQHFGRRSMAAWMCADMLMVLLHQLFGKRGVTATPASCFQGGVLCVYPQATIKTSREPRFNHRRRSPSNRNTLLQTRRLRYQKSGPKQQRLITKAAESQWPDFDPCNYLLYQSCASSSRPRRFGGR